MAACSRSQTAPRRGGREGEKEREKEEEFQKVCKMRLQGIVAGFFSFLLSILGLLKGAESAQRFAAQPLKYNGRGGFMSSLVPYFAFKIFKAPQKALRGSFKVWKASAIMLF